MHLAKGHRTRVTAWSVAILLGASLVIGIGHLERPPVVREIDRDRPASDDPDEALKFRRLQLQDERGYIPPDGLQKAREHVEGMKAAQQKRLKTQLKTEGQQGLQPEAGGIQPNSWTWLGPGNVGGRIRTIVIHPTNPNSMWIGSVSGGIWRTTDAGTSWQPVNDFMASLAISTMVINPVNPTIMYAGTGEGFTNNGIDLGALQGAGIFQSTDGGVTWNQLASTNPAAPAPKGCGVGAAPCPTFWLFVNRLAISPNGGTILAATNSGIASSTDGGANWTQETNTQAFDVDFQPANNAQAVAGGAGVVMFRRLSPIGLVTWTAATFNPAISNDGTSANNGRVELAYAPSNPNIVYAAVNNNNGDVYRSTDGGQTGSVRQTFARVNTGTNFFLGGGGNQGSYDNAIWVNPKDATNIMVGGIDLWGSFNSGQTLTQRSVWQCGPGGNPGNPCSGQSAHADQHMIVAHPGFNNTTNKVVYFTNDGGLFRTDDVSTVSLTNGWINLNNGLGITQFYGAAKNPHADMIMGGAQDNGTVTFSGLLGTPWDTAKGGDGGFCAADPRNFAGRLPTFYGETPKAEVFRSFNGGATASDTEYIYCDGAHESPPKVCLPGKGIADTNNGANFVAPLTLDPNNPDTLLVGGLSLWRSDVSKPDPTWEAIKSPGINPISAITVSPNTSAFILVGDNKGNIFLTLQGNANAATVQGSWNNISAGLPTRFVTSIAIDNTKSPNWIYATFGGFSPDNVYRSTDLGKTWNRVTGSGVTALPSVPVRSLAINPRHPNFLYVGTEIGIFTSEDAGATWEVPQDGPANVSVDQVFWMTEDFGADELIAVTHGRGIYIASGGIYVDPNFTGVERGTFLEPFRTIPRAIAAAKTYQPIWIKAGTYNDRLTITKPLELRSQGGLVVIGKQ